MTKFSAVKIPTIRDLLINIRLLKDLNNTRFIKIKQTKIGGKKPTTNSICKKTHNTGFIDKRSTVKISTIRDLSKKINKKNKERKITLPKKLHQ